MAITSSRLITIQLSGDYDAAIEYEALNAASPGDIAVVDLTSGNNAISVPSGATGVTIVLPTTNTVVVTLKGVNGDTGVALHLTDPSSIALGSTVTTFVLNAASALTGIRLIWS
jgi:hypothetical protein